MLDVHTIGNSAVHFHEHGIPCYGMDPVAAFERLYERNVGVRAVCMVVDKVIYTAEMNESELYAAFDIVDDEFICVDHSYMY